MVSEFSEGAGLGNRWLTNIEKLTHWIVLNVIHRWFCNIDRLLAKYIVFLAQETWKQVYLKIHVARCLVSMRTLSSRLINLCRIL